MLRPDPTTLITLIAFLLIAWDASRKEKNPLVMLAGFGLLLVAIVLQLFGGGGIVRTATGFFMDVGLGFVAASLLLAVRKVRFLAFTLLGLLALGLGGLIALGSRVVETPEDEASLLLELGPDDRIEEVAAVLDRYGLRYEQAFPEVDLMEDEDLAQTYLIFGERKALEEAAEILREDRENVDYTAWNETIELELPLTGEPSGERQALANDPLASQQWAIEAIRMDGAHALLRDRRPVRKAVVAIIDTGVDAHHEDVTAAFKAKKVTVDENGHGTHCAGIAGALANNGVGIASLNWEGRFFNVVAYQALDARGVGTHEQIAQAIIDAAEDHADVLSISLGEYTTTAPRVVVNAVKYALRNGAVVVASAGNGSRDGIDHMPSNIEGVIAVAAVDQNLERAKFSNTVGRLSRPIAAPGVDILSLAPGNGYRALSGTSMATPHVAGLAGVLRALNPDLTADQIYTLIHETGITLPASNDLGRLINTEAAIKAALSDSYL